MKRYVITIFTAASVFMSAVSCSMAACNKEIGVCKISDLPKETKVLAKDNATIMPPMENKSLENVRGKGPSFRNIIESLLKPLK